MTTGLLLFGGPVLYLGAQAWYFHATIGEAWVERVLACVVAVAGVSAVWLPPLASIAVLDAVLIAVVIVLLRTDQRMAITSTSTPHSREY